MSELTTKNAPSYVPTCSASWMPIDTAPRDGTLILVTGLDKGTGPSRHYCAAAWMTCDHFGPRFAENGLSDESLAYLTHWMPDSFSAVDVLAPAGEKTPTKPKDD